MAVALITAVPFVLALFTGLFGRRLPAPILSWSLAGAMALLCAVLLSFVPDVTESGAFIFTIEWVPQLSLALSFYLDGLSLLFGVVVTGIGIAVFGYGGHYFEDDAETARFQTIMLIFAGAMLGTVFAGNLLTLFIMWELTSITSFLLIGFKGDKYESARFGAMQALMVTGAGGLELLIGVVLLGTAVGSMELSVILGQSVADHPWYTGITILIIMGAFAKSAQFPFHFWLPGAKDAPAPASAYLHSATMVKLGVYLCARLYPTLGNTELWTTALVTVGLASLLISSVLAVRARDLKSILAYTTIGQLGALIALLGLPNEIGIKAAMVGILGHALYKAPMFLVAGVVDHATGTRDVNHLGGLRRYLPRLTIITGLAGLSMAGMIPWFGFVSKETLLEAFLDNPAALIVIVISAALTVTVALIIFWDVFMRPAPDHLHFHDPGPGIMVGPGLLAGLGTVLGLLLPITVTPFITPAVGKSVSLALIPYSATTLAAFALSTAAILGGVVLFTVRPWLVNMPWPRLIPSGESVYRAVVALVEWVADLLLMTQNGKIRHYLVIILGSFLLMMAAGGVIGVAIAPIEIDFSDIRITAVNLMDMLLLVLALGATLASILFKEHLYAALALGVMGYAVGGLFLLEPGPDVALVQILVETLGTVLIILMIGRINTRHRAVAMERVWGRSRHGVVRDALIATALGVVVGLFALAAVSSRDERTDFTIATWHIENAYPETGVTDVVASILADFRGTDTLIEITVFAAGALGVLTLLTISRTPGEADGTAGSARRVSNLSTPFTRQVAALVLPFALLISVSHILYEIGRASCRERVSEMV